MWTDASDTEREDRKRGRHADCVKGADVATNTKMSRPSQLLKTSHKIVPEPSSVNLNSTRLYAIPANYRQENDSSHVIWDETQKNNPRTEFDLYQHSHPFNSWRPVGKLSVSSEISAKSLKTLRFSTSCSRATNTHSSVQVSRTVQTVPNVYKFRLNTWPLLRDKRWTTSRSARGRCDVCMRRFLSFMFSQMGILIFLSMWVAINGAMFHYLEHKVDNQVVTDVVSKKKEIVISLATDLRQVSPYELAWRKKIGEYFDKFENLLVNATLSRNVKTDGTLFRSSYSDSVLFCLQLVTGMGKSTISFRLHSTNQFAWQGIRFQRLGPQVNGLCSIHS